MDILDLYENRIIQIPLSVLVFSVASLGLYKGFRLSCADQTFPFLIKTICLVNFMAASKCSCLKYLSCLCCLKYLSCLCCLKYLYLVASTNIYLVYVSQVQIKYKYLYLVASTNIYVVSSTNL